MSDPEILPWNILRMYWCSNCNINLEVPYCPKCNVPKQEEAPPPLGVHVSEVMGAKCKVGG